MEPIRISKDTLRKFLITYQGLSGHKKLSGKEGILNYFQRVGSIQYDPLKVVSRNADLVLQSRIYDYTPFMLDELLYQDRRLMDGWDKMMSIYQASDFPYFLQLRKDRKDGIENTLRHRKQLHALDYYEEIYEYIKKNGPSTQGDIPLGSLNRDSWGHGTYASVVMDYMYHMGVLGVHSKKNAQKTYDLVERLYPEVLVTKKEPFQHEQDFYMWAIKRRIGSIGIYWHRNGGGWIGHRIENKGMRDELIPKLIEKGEIVPVKVTEFEKESFYVRKEDVDLLLSHTWTSDDRVRFIAPLDNLMWDRKLMKDVFDFEYSWEVYVPEFKRKYGYYVLPVLYQDRFIARFEPLHHKDNEELIIKNWWWEEDYMPNASIIDKVTEALMKFSNYLGGSGVSKESLKKIESVSR